ncbi:hypothetical protein BJ138DRAFT_409605 [Hygrophoropsis aurantiaca]|uniref:Uncharacterized protein n=1 Tax=Hygrophoropsis aurantiaca TaxID=72124 RepID=A0ACB8A4N3_9AGAM|nr:hypothetical protein BJ138DRAFT_409605 [Hygrophoropsis aurantiaca]
MPSTSSRKGPNPFLFFGLSLVSFGAFLYIVKRREVTYPASKQPRQQDNPLVPPRHRDPS